MQNAPESNQQKNEGDCRVKSAVLGPLRAARKRFACKDKSNEKTSDPNYQIAKWTQTVANWTRGLVIVGAITALILALQFWTLIQSERAFLTLGAMSFQPTTPAAGNKILISYELKNSGRSAAVIEKTSVNFAFGTLPSIPNYRNTVDALSPIPAESSLPAHVGPSAQNGELTVWDKDLAQAIATQKIPFFIYGFIRYKDDFSTVFNLPIFGKMVLGFCYEYSPKDVPDSTFTTCGNTKYTYADRYWINP